MVFFQNEKISLSKSLGRSLNDVEQDRNTLKTERRLKYVKGKSIKNCVDIATVSNPKTVSIIIIVYKHWRIIWHFQWKFL